MSKEFDHEVKFNVDGKEYDLTEESNRALVLVLGPSVFMAVGNDVKDIASVLGADIAGLRVFCQEIAKEGKADDLLAGFLIHQFLSLCEASDKVNDQFNAIAMSINAFFEEGFNGEDCIK